MLRGATYANAERQANQHFGRTSSPLAEVAPNWTGKRAEDGSFPLRWRELSLLTPIGETGGGVRPLGLRSAQTATARALALSTSARQLLYPGIPHGPLWRAVDPDLWSPLPRSRPLVAVGARGRDGTRVDSRLRSRWLIGQQRAVSALQEDQRIGPQGVFVEEPVEGADSGPSEGSILRECLG
jgi:hypothetical protein